MKKLLQSLALRWAFSKVPAPAFLLAWAIHTKTIERLTAYKKGGRP